MKNNLQILTNNGVLELNNWMQVNNESREFSKNLIVQVLENKFYNDTLPIYKCYITDSVYKLVVLILHNEKAGRIEENDIIKINRITSGSTNDSSGKMAVIKNYEILYRDSKEDELELSPSDTKIILSEIQRESNTNENLNYANKYTRNDLLLNIKNELNSVLNPTVLKQNLLTNGNNDNNKERVMNQDQNKINTLKIDTINMNTINKNKLVNKFDPNFLNNFKSNSLFNIHDQNLNLNLNSDQYLREKPDSNEIHIKNEKPSNDKEYYKRNETNYNKNINPNNNIANNNNISNNTYRNSNYDNYVGKNINGLNSIRNSKLNDISGRENRNMSNNSKNYALDSKIQDNDDEDIINLLEDEENEIRNNFYQNRDSVKNNMYNFNNKEINRNNNINQHFINVRENNLASNFIENNYRNNYQNTFYNNAINKKNFYPPNVQQQRSLNQNTNIPSNNNNNFNHNPNNNRINNQISFNDHSKQYNYNNNSNYTNNSAKQFNSIARNNPNQIVRYKKNNASISNLSLDERFDNLNSIRKPDVIKNLTTLNTQIFLRVRCLYKSEKKTYQNNTKNVFNFNVIDSEGSEMPITCFDLICDKFYDLIEVNSIYEISGGYLKVNDKRFTRVNSDLKLYLDESTILRKVKDTFVSEFIPTQKYNFVKIEKISTLSLNKIIDLLCYVLEIKETKTITSKKSNRDTNLKVLRVTDDTFFKIDVSIWGSYANENYCPGQILAIRYVKIGEFKGRNLSVCDSVSMQFEPNFSEALEMKEKIKNYEGEFKDLPHFINEVYGLENNGMKIINIGDLVNYLNSLNVDNVTLGECIVKGTVLQMIHSEKNYYSGCPVCKKKLSIEENNYCVKCKQNYEKSVKYFHINLVIKDETGELGLDILGENAENILAIKCDEYKELFEGNLDEKLYEVSDKLEFQTYYFTLIPRIAIFENKSNKRFTCAKFEKIDKDESTRLKEMEEYRTNRFVNYNEDLNEMNNSRNNHFKSFINRGDINENIIKNENKTYENANENIVIDIQENSSNLSGIY